MNGEKNNVENKQNKGSKNVFFKVVVGPRCRLLAEQVQKLFLIKKEKVMGLKPGEYKSQESIQPVRLRQTIQNETIKWNKHISENRRKPGEKPVWNPGHNVVRITWAQIHRKGHRSHVKKQLTEEQNTDRKRDAKHDTQGQNGKTKQEVVIETPNMTWTSCTVLARSGCFPVAEVWPVIMDILEMSSCRQSQGNGGSRVEVRCW